MTSEFYSNGILTESDYQGAGPIVPIQQIPEITDLSSEGGFVGDAPFIVYDFLTPGGYDTEYWNCRDDVMFWIYDYDIEKIFEIKEFMYDLFRRFDLTARDINEFPDPAPYKFQYFDIQMGLPTDEADQILGRKGANMVITYQYDRAIQANGRFA